MPDRLDPLIHGVWLSGSGRADALVWDDIKSGPLRDGRPSWIHLNRLSPDVQDWLRETSGLNAIETEVLLEEDTRPRAVRYGDAILINLRGINLNEGAEPEDMVALRIYFHADTLLTLRAYPIRAVSELMAEIQAGRAPATTQDILVSLAERLTDRLDELVGRLDDQVADFEDRLLETTAGLKKTELATFRRRVLRLRRYIIPQREALNALTQIGSDVFSANESLRLKELTNQITRIAEDLDTIRERSTVLQEQIIEQRAEAMNDRLFLLAIISAVFLPLGFVTGLFGVNVGGMPGVETPWSFAALCVLCILISGVLLWLFRRRGWV